MNFFNAIIIGFVQGVGEFLPISSSGHLVVLYTLFNITGNTVILSIFLHIATLFSVLYVYRADIIQLIKTPFCKTNKMLVVATIPTVVIALILKGLITNSFNINFVIFGFLITAVALGFADYLSQDNNILSNNNDLSTITPSRTRSGSVVYVNNPLLKNRDITNINISIKQALLIGVAQGIACFPGISRSGATIATGLIAKGEKQDVTTFSFLLSIPIILGSLVMALFDLDGATRIPTFSLITACLISFLVGIVAINLLNTVVKKKQLSNFSFYLIGLVFAILLFRLIF